eukprot:scaffold919_cov130-Cylindrotheca_fusiformis.AAC.1
MVASTLKDVAGKGWDWYKNSESSSTPTTSNPPPPPPPSSSSAGKTPNMGPRTAVPEALQVPEFEKEQGQDLPGATSTKYWNFAQHAAESTFSTVSGYMTSILPSSLSSDKAPEIPEPNQSIPMTPSYSTSTAASAHQSVLTSPTARLLNVFQNPYSRVRGPRGADKPSSMEAVRNLLTATAPGVSYQYHHPTQEYYFATTTTGTSPDGSDLDEDAYYGGSGVDSEQDDHSPIRTLDQQQQPRRSSDTLRNLMGGFFVNTPTSSHYYHHQKQGQTPQNNNNNSSSIHQAFVATDNSPSETASQLAEGTLRAFRDIALDEAVELHSALRYWSYRWERPFLSWLEAGPTVWFSEDGYRHQVIGQKVSQIQAVLARRCVTIGDLQHHLLRSGWQQGVAQWGVLGDGGDFATMTGFDGRMPSQEEEGDEDSDDAMQHYLHNHHRKRSSMSSSGGGAGNGGRMPRVSSELSELPLPPRSTGGPDLPRQAPTSKVSQLPQQRQTSSIYYTNVNVKNNPGGRIVTDNPALAEWSVDAMSIVRKQLYRAANGQVVLPFAENWAQGDDQSLSYNSLQNFMMDDSTAATNESQQQQKLPLWASLKPQKKMETVEERLGSEDTNDEPEQEENGPLVRNEVTISDLPLMVQEVSELLDVMEGIMDIQRARRLHKLKQPSMLRRSWYVIAMGVSAVTYFMYKTRDKQYGWVYVKYAGKKLAEFFQEHVVSPFLAIYDELTTGTENVTDHKARDIVIDNLQKMIRSWLDEAYPDMPAAERARMAMAMDVTLIENQKEASMKNIYELNNVIRLSFIEAQFIKKEMMNALLALDEMRASTNFNLNMAAVTPFVMLIYLTKRSFQFVFYAILKWGKSREETYGSFLHILTEIERLLNIRDNPPTLTIQNGEDTQYLRPASLNSGDCVLNTDDLGMLMLHIHTLRTILWRDRRRFSSSAIRSVAEDLAELAGERGAVSVRQQLQIIGRMHRTYPFLKMVGADMIGYDGRQ